LDVMHYKKNICKNMLKKIFGKKNIVVVRKDTEEVSIWLELWLKQLLNFRYIKPIAPYVLINEKKKFFPKNYQIVENSNKLCCKVEK
jgi:hypothetical protein